MPQALKSLRASDIDSICERFDGLARSLGLDTVFWQVTRSPVGRAPASVTLQIDTEQRLGGLTVWENGHLDYEVIDASTGESVSCVHREGVDVEITVSLASQFLGRVAVDVTG